MCESVRAIELPALGLHPVPSACRYLLQCEVHIGKCILHRESMAGAGGLVELNHCPSAMAGVDQCLLPAPLVATGPLKTPRASAFAGGFHDPSQSGGPSALVGPCVQK